MAKASKDSIDKVCKDIQELRIRGARNVARAAIEALGIAIKESPVESKEELMNDILVTADKIAGLRATEPMLDNLFRMLIQGISKEKDVKEMKKAYFLLEKKFSSAMERNMERIVGYGANLIRDNSTVLTHCHSSTVEKILVRANSIKRIRVICTETRPMYQGRITARNLSRQGLDVTLIADSAVASVMKEVDMVIVGADVVTARGALINKIGTSAIAIIAYEEKTPFYSACELWKFDPATKWGAERSIEQRNPKEIISDVKSAELRELEKVKILNPAFDITESKYISGYITEEGIVSAQDFARIAEKALGN